jgi:hypothetical protein
MDLGPEIAYKQEDIKTKEDCYFNNIIGFIKEGL